MEDTDKLAMITEKDPIWKRPNASELLKQAIKHGCEFNITALLKIFELPDAAEVIRLYLMNEGYLPYEFEVKMFDVPNASSLIRFYLDYELHLGERAQLRLFELPDAEELIKLYIDKGGRFGGMVESKLFYLPHANELIKLYIENDGLGKVALQQQLTGLAENSVKSGLVTFANVCKACCSADVDLAFLKELLKSNPEWINRKVDSRTEASQLLDDTQLMRKFNIVRILVQNTSLLGIAIAHENEKLQQLLVDLGADEKKVVEGYYTINSELSADCLNDLQRILISTDSKELAVSKLRGVLSRYGIK